MRKSKQRLKALEHVQKKMETYSRFYHGVDPREGLQPSALFLADVCDSFSVLAQELRALQEQQE